MKTPFKRLATLATLGSALLAPAASQAFILTQDWLPLPPGLIVGLPVPQLPCLTGTLCLGSWITPNLPSLAAGQTLDLNAMLASSSFSLAAGLSGQYQLTLSPAYQTPGVWAPAYAGGGYIPPVDELRLTLASQYQLVGSSSQGRLSFNADPAEQYYLLLDGIARPGQDYQLSLAAVPEPETWAMLLAGLGIVGVAARRRAAAQA